jgi:uncharacterized membrane protein YvbJ
MSIMRFCSNCGKELQDGVFYCSFCGSSLSGANFQVKEKLAEARHNEIISEFGVFFGFFIMALGLLIPASGGFFVLVGVLFLFVGAAFCLHYSRKREKLIKQIS